jgi:4,5-dihydroxyphthalate decarboxylase
MNIKQKTKRRKFLKTTALGAGLLGSLSSFNFKNKLSGIRSVKADLHLKMTGYDYPRIKAIYDKKVNIKNCSFDIVKSGGIGDMNTNVFNGPQSFDVTEIGMVPFILAYANEGFRDYTLLPIFPLRMFRHKSIFIHADSGITKPHDLIGKKIGTPGYSSSSLTWIRGMFQDEYGISPNDVQWVIATKDSSGDISGQVSKQESVIPEGISLTYGTKGKDESELLLSGEVDALFHAVQPKAFIEGNPKIIRLFKDSKKVEQEYFSKTGIFPIMHAVAVKKELLENNPWLAQSLFNAYSESKTMDYNFITKLGWAYDTLPWYGQEYEETKKVMGENFWPYGIDVNRKTMETICRYCFEQGLIKKKISFEDMFHSASLQFSEK